MRSVVLSCALVFVVSAASAAPAKKATTIVPNSTEIAVYVPPAALTARSYYAATNMWIEPGKSFDDALNEVGVRFFPAMHVVPGTSDERYGLLLDLSPKWAPASGKIKLTVQYDVYGTDGRKLHSNTVEQLAPLKVGNFNATAVNASRLAIQQVMADVQRSVKPDPVKFPAQGMTSKIDLTTLVDREKPLRTGTAFFVNKTGQLLTAAHVARNCVLLEAHQDGTTFPVTAKASSDLLDITVLESGKARASAIALRQGHEIVLGEGITSVAYPQKGVVGDAPNLTRGNVSSSKGIRGSLGMFQFSAPMQSGNNGGPIVSDNGELLGMAVSTLNAELLTKHGHIPQNVSFALDARHVAKFLQREKVPFDLIRPQGAGGLQVANQAALSNTVQLNCYQ